MESEFIALSKNAQKEVWLKRLLTALLDCDVENKPVKVFSDSQAAIAAIENMKYHSRTKHIDEK